MQQMRIGVGALAAPRIPLGVATAVATAAVVAFLAAAMALQAGLSSWLDGTIYLLAAVPATLSVKFLLKNRWREDASAKRKGLIFGIVAWALTVDAWAQVTASRQALAAKERELEPIIESLARYRELHGAYPVALHALGDAGRAAARHKVYYTNVEGDSYLLVFRHDLVVDHRFSPGRGTWIDTL